MIEVSYSLVVLLDGFKSDLVCKPSYYVRVRMIPAPKESRHNDDYRRRNPYCYPVLHLHVFSTIL